MTLMTKKCGLCQQDVEYDSDAPAILLNPKRDKIRHPRALHICPGPPKPKSLNQQFMEAPELFLQSHVVVVDEEEQLSNGGGRRQRFKLTQGRRNATLLSFQNTQGQEGIDAYWLPWFTMEATTMTLGNEAKFFFTSELTNCRFKVLDPNPKAPRVAHVAGTLLGKKRKEDAEMRAGFVEPPTTRARSLSISEGKDIKASQWVKVAVPKKHEYRGQAGDASSAFVFGWKDDDDNWNFRAQIVKGNMSDTGIIKNTLEEDLQILDYCYRI